MMSLLGLNAQADVTQTKSSSDARLAFCIALVEKP
jgi:hypothetical protein